MRGFSISTQQFPLKSGWIPLRFGYVNLLVFQFDVINSDPKMSTGNQIWTSLSSACPVVFQVVKDFISCEQVSEIAIKMPFTL